MTTFQVDDMTCGHCVGAITKAVKSLDADAAVSIDLATHRVAIESTKAETAKLSAAITEAGYAPVALAHPAAKAAATQAKRGGCCCG
jgi:copper chaperone